MVDEETGEDFSCVKRIEMHGMMWHGGEIEYLDKNTSTTTVK